uniref:GNAT family N-acetyltransferase n=2 Tax=Bacteria TaxID=2 RepID=UPI0038B2B87C
KAQAFWRNVAEGVARNERALLIAEDADGAVLGTVQLVLAQPENQPHRADVAKMLVHRRARRRGIAQQLMAALDDIARA